MARNTARTILQRQLDTRRKLWPDLTNQMLWSMDNDGWVAIPRLMPLIMSIMDDLSGKGFPVGQTYLEMWSRIRIEESFLILNRPEEMAFHAGFEGQRALRTWKDRVRRLEGLGFISIQPGPLGDLSYVAFFNPYHIIKRAYLDKKIQEKKWQALMVRANEVNALDIDDIDEFGNIVASEEIKKDNEEKRHASKSRRTARTTRNFKMKP
ncbi:MAG: hypothetical protein DI549_17365 [Ancylobacter novellus]|uniref:Uncharacterized protein n=1 Tax=Ancylobacter novellus TaxID=921 RepID=A0A2W5QT67_ANCNO|nr:MAG: hypothetical protein DI549_17365 [Ancylobacter novellus]